MPFHSDAGLDAAFDTSYGSATDGSVVVDGGDNYAVAVIVQKDVDTLDETSGIEGRSTLLEFRKSGLADSSAGLLIGTQVIIGSRTYTIQNLESESTYTLIYFVT